MASICAGVGGARHYPRYTALPRPSYDNQVGPSTGGRWRQLQQGEVGVENVPVLKESIARFIVSLSMLFWSPLLEPRALSYRFERMPPWPAANVSTGMDDCQENERYIVEDLHAYNLVARTNLWEGPVQPLLALESLESYANKT